MKGVCYWVKLDLEYLLEMKSKNIKLIQTDLLASLPKRGVMICYLFIDVLVDLSSWHVKTGAWDQ